MFNIFNKNTNDEVKNEIFFGDCLEGMKYIPDKSIDLIICDLPYGTTKNKWDKLIPLNDYIEINDKKLEKDDFYLKQALNGCSKKEIDTIWKTTKKEGLWSHYERIIKDNGCIILFGQGVFSAELILSNRKLFKYSLIWEKDRVTGFLNARKMPLRSHEDILIFYKKPPIYNPQMWEGIPLHSKGKNFVNKDGKNSNYGNYNTRYESDRVGTTEKFPRSVLKFPKEHPPKFATQKPTSLCEYLIKTYTNENAIIVDNCMGSGSSLIGANKLPNRYCIGMEITRENYELSKERLSENKILFREVKNFEN